ncbi:methionine adenosyltransferase domain-containing protein [bacterium]|nr:MAG: methionine adenosyltransferase domain-containing protein [bacterium]
MSQQLRTAEFVSPKHPDKICDYIADRILDEHLKLDPHARVAVEVMGGHGLITHNGEITSNAQIDYEQVVKDIVGSEYKVIFNIAQQSPEIARGVDIGGAGDQGIMVGYACSNTPDNMPLEYSLARQLCQDIYKQYPYDGKVQVTVDYGGAGAANSAADNSDSSNFKITCVVASFQNSKSSELEELVRSLIAADRYLINPAGQWSQGGFDADSGLSGRKLVVDAYGPHVPIGGGSFSGKDYTKVDRSGAYYARKVAVDLLSKQIAAQANSNPQSLPQEVLVKIAYAIGVAKPVMATAYFTYPDGINLADGSKNGLWQDISHLYDFSPKAICEILDLARPQYAELSQWGHFGRGNVWDRPFTETL